LGNGPAIRSLLEFQKKEDPDVLFLSETKLDEKRLQWFKWKLGLVNMVAKDCDGQSGGLALFWRSDVNLTAGLKSRYHIDATIIQPDGFKWRFTGIYGDPKTEKRENTWKLLRNIKHHSKLPWMCAGDFNEILFDFEKEGGAMRPQSQMDKFRDTLADCNLHDLGFVGDPFTWRNNSCTSQGYIKERLDRAVATKEWYQHFSDYKVVNGDPGHSDHRPIIIHLLGTYVQRPADGVYFTRSLGNPKRKV
jgi:exonuclease III